MLPKFFMCDDRSISIVADEFSVVDTIAIVLNRFQFPVRIPSQESAMFEASFECSLFVKEVGAVTAIFKRAV